MHESFGGVLLGILGIVGLTYLGVKVRQNQRRLQRIVAVVDARHTFEAQYLFALADGGQLKMYSDMTNG